MDKHSTLKKKADAQNAPAMQPTTPEGGAGAGVSELQGTDSFATEPQLIGDAADRVLRKLHKRAQLLVPQAPTQPDLHQTQVETEGGGGEQGHGLGGGRDQRRGVTEDVGAHLLDRVLALRLGGKG